MGHKKTPGEIERTSMDIIREELAMRGVALPAEQASVVLRVIHATADFDYTKTMFFSQEAVSRTLAALRRAVPIVTDTNMARAGISTPGLEKIGGKAMCFMADPGVADRAREAGSTRAAAAMRYAAAQWPGAVYAVGNAPTALFQLAEEIERGCRPALVIAVPVGFVNVVEAKKKIVEICQAHDVPVIAAMGRKGGSTVAAAICNALIYEAADMSDPLKRGWG